MNYAVDLCMLYDELEQAGVNVFAMAINTCDALASPRGYLAMDPAQIETDEHEREILLHESGHFATATFYEYDSPFTVRQHQENLANRWCYHKYFPLEIILDLMRAGYTESWQLAEQLGVGEDYVRNLLAYYQDACGIDFAAAAAS